MSATQVIRPRAKEAMAKRTRVTFGQSFLNGVLGGFHRDQAKMVVLAHALKVGSPSDLKALKLETLREKLAAAIMAAPAETLPRSVPAL